MGDPGGFQGNGTKASFPFFLKKKRKKKEKHTYLAWLGLRCGTQDFNCSMWGLVPQPGMEPRPLRWELGILAAGPSGKSLVSLLGFGR